MKKILLGLMALALLAAPASAGDYEKKAEGAWFDFSCGMCGNLAQQEGLLDALDWNHYGLDDGMVVVTNITPGFEEKYAAAAEGMMATGAKMAAGEEVHMCGHCTSMSALSMHSDVVARNVETKTGHISVMTGKTPEAVKAIHKHMKTTMKEMEKMMAAEATESR